MRRKYALATGLILALVLAPVSSQYVGGICDPPDRRGCPPGQVQDLPLPRIIERILSPGTLLGAPRPEAMSIAPAPSAAPQAQVMVELVGRLGSDCRGIQIVGNYAYTTLGQEMAVLDISDPTQARRIGYTPLPVSGRDIDVVGNYAYVLGQYGSLQVVDVSDPTQPAIVGAYATPGAGLDVSGQYAYVVDRSGGGLQVIDVSDPTHPTLEGSCATEGLEVYVLAGDPPGHTYAYVAGDGDGLRVVDVSDPAAPFEVGSVPASAQGVYVLAGNPPGHTYAYVADYSTSGGSWLRVVDVSDPTNPVEVGQEEVFLGVWGEAYDVYVSAGDPPGHTYAYVAGSAYIGGGASYGGIEVVDVSDPANPDSVNNYVAPNIRRTYDVTVSGNHAFMPAGPAGLRVMDIADPAHPTEAGVWRVLDGAADIVVADDSRVGLDQTYAYVTAWGVTAIDVSDLVYPVVAGSYAVPPPSVGSAEKLALSGGYAYMLDPSGGLKIVDVSDPTHPTEAGSYETWGRDVAAMGDYVYLVANPDLIILDVSNPANPGEVGSFDIAGDAQSIHVSADVPPGHTYAYLATSFGLWIMDVSDPANPAEAGYIELSHGASSVHVLAGDPPGHTYAYVIGGSYGDNVLWVVDVSDPANPDLAGTCAMPGWADLVHASAGGLHGRTYAYVAGDDLWVVDVSNPAQPTLAGSYVTPWDVSFYGVVVVGDHVYATTGEMLILHIAPMVLRASPSRLGFLAEVGGSDPLPRTVQIESGVQGVTWTTALSPTFGWIELSPLSGTTPASLTVSAHISGLSVGRYETQLFVEGGSGVTNPAGITVTLIVADPLYNVYLPLTLREQ